MQGNLILGSGVDAKGSACVSSWLLVEKIWEEVLRGRFAKDEVTKAWHGSTAIASSAKGALQTEHETMMASCL